MEEIFERSSGHPIDFFRSIEGDDGCEIGFHQRSAVCTNTYIEAYLKYRYNPTAPTLWYIFDVIVWDELHALLADSSYQSAPFHVMQLIGETLTHINLSVKNEALPEEERDPAIRKPTCQQIIFMSVTPESLKSIPLIQNTHTLEMRETCRCVVPKNIHFITPEQAVRQINEQLQQGLRIVYFPNNVPLPDELLKKYRLPENQLAVSFSTGKLQA